MYNVSGWEKYCRVMERNWEITQVTLSMIIDKVKG